jgi:uncharacterized protein
MERQVMWSSQEEPGLEYLRLLQLPDGIVADSIILGVHEQKPFHIHYEIQCNAQWRLQTVHVNLLSGSSAQSLHLFVDNEGTWTTEGGEIISSLQGCLDVDISATPFTNTLPIRRLSLQQGSVATLSMAYIMLPQLQLKVTEQRYSCLDVTPVGERYRFESLKVDGTSSFTAELPVDKDGLVLDYPGLFRRVGNR